MSEPVKKIKKQCTCGKEFETYPNLYNDDPYYHMCPDCNKNDWWRLATRMLKLEKFKCVKCSWKLTKKDAYGCDENVLWFRCRCCGYDFGLYFRDCY